MTAPRYGQQINVYNFPDKPKIGERHRECAREIKKPHWHVGRLRYDTPEEIIAKHFPEDDENVARIDIKLAADRISALSPGVFETIGTYKTVLEIINGCRRD